MRLILETRCPRLGASAIVSRPWLFRRRRPLRCSACGAIVPSESHPMLWNVGRRPTRCKPF